tara:strand:- start:12773 stop:13024 length:252 start_codon:yes stop_codon:yes gene_type:complete
MESVDFTVVVEVVLFAFLAALGVMWRNQSQGLKETEAQLHDLHVQFSEFKGTSGATNRTIFATLEEMKGAIERIENHLLNRTK